MNDVAPIVGEPKPVEVGSIDVVPPNMLPEYLARFLADRGRRRHGGALLPLQVIHANYLVDYGRALKQSTALLAWVLHAHARWHAEGGGDLPPAEIGSCWPGVTKLANIANTSETNVKQFLIPELEEAGFARVERKKGSVNRYHLTFSAVEPVPRPRRSSARQELLTGGPSRADDVDRSSRFDTNNEENHEPNNESRTSGSETHGGSGEPTLDLSGSRQLGPLAVRLLDGEHRGEIRYVSSEAAATLVRRGRAAIVDDERRASA